MEGDVPEDSLIARSDIRVVLAGLSLFEGLSPATLAAIADELEWMSLPGGAPLFEAGEPSDALYVVLSGSLGTFAPESSRDRRRFIARIGAGETVGEMGLISGRARTANVIALRDTELGRLSRDTFERVIRNDSDAMLSILKLTVSRLENASGAPRRRMQGPRTFTLVPQSIDVDVASFAIELVDCLTQLGRTELVWSVRGADHTSHWFHKIESANDFVVYVADPRATTWSKLCVRQADALLLLARAEYPAGPFAAIAETRNARSAPQRSELVLLHTDAMQTGAARRWCAEHPGMPHHHVLESSDIRRIARLMTGHAVGLVLSGGGARGFAHIGVIQALREKGVPIDLIGGTSIGAIMGAAGAAGWTQQQMQERFRRTFVSSNPLGDYTLPVISLASGRRVSERLRNEFGDVDIEDLRLPFYCVSANLTTGHPGVHRQGRLWKWVRASAAIPGVLPPVSENGEVFVDGGAMNNLPVDIMRDLGRGPVIGVDIGADPAFRANGDDLDIPPAWHVNTWGRTWRRRPNIVQILVRSGMVNSAAATAARRDQTDLLLQPDLKSIDMLNWKAFDQAVEAGYRYSLQRLSELTPELAERLHVGRPDAIG